MDIPTLFAIGLAIVALVTAGAALYTAWKTQRLLMGQTKQPDNQKNERYSEIANMLSDGSLVWQRLSVQCDELSATLSSSFIQGNTKETIGDWLLQLRDFSRRSKTEIDHGYQLFGTEAKSMSSDELAMQHPDMEKFNKEMRSNVVAISDQLAHIDSILQGHEPVGSRQFKLTLHKPQVLPHFLRKRQKIAELQRRHSRPINHEVNVG